MLCQFTFQNFKSYKGETTLDFQAAMLPEFRETLITEDKAADLLPVSVIYGPNGGGKSNLLQALSCVISTIVKPVHDLGKNRQELILQQKVDAIPFLFDQTSANEPTEFRMFFRIDTATTSPSNTMKLFQSHYTVKQLPARNQLPSLNARPITSPLVPQSIRRASIQVLIQRCRISPFLPSTMTSQLSMKL